MIRTQISLTDEERRALDSASARTGQSMSALIRNAVDMAYGSERSLPEDLAAMRRAFGAWGHRLPEGKLWVDRLRSGRRLSTPQ